MKPDSVIWLEFSPTISPCFLYLQKLWIMQKISYFFPLLFIFLDACVVHSIRLAQLSPALISHPFLVLWGGGITRACVLTLLILKCPGSLPWMSSFEGQQSLGVLCFHFPLYTTLLWMLGQPIMEHLWGWHCWERVGGFVTSSGHLSSRSFFHFKIKYEIRGATIRTLIV